MSTKEMKRQHAVHDIHFVEFAKHGAFRVDENGVVWKCKTWRKGQWADVRIERPLTSKCNGYVRATLKYMGKHHYIAAHRLVWILTYGQIDSTLDINHKNGIRDDNRIANLELISRSGNVKHAFDVLDADRHLGEAQGANKLTREKVLEIVARCKSGQTFRSIARDYGISNGTVSAIMGGRNWGWLTGFTFKTAI